jgi:crotonobetainyl-CoA:carnitine CoA-transferase CaiB-like acyl-CoA transferase
MILADLGADVLKIEPPETGEPVRSIPPKLNREGAFFLALNRNKRSMTLNLKSSRGKDIFLRLASSFDVVLESFRAGTAERLGVHYEAVKKANPSIVYCSLSGYGQNGPYSRRSSHDINYLALSGILSITGLKNSGPVLPGIQLADVSGALYAVVGILASLLHRNAGGAGQHVDVSMLDGCVSLVGLHMMKYFVDGILPGRETMLTNGVLPCYRVYKTRDERWMALGALEPKFWERFCRLANREDLIDRQFPPDEERDEVIGAVESIFLERTRKEWMELFSREDVCCEPVKNFPEALEDPQISSRGMILSSVHPTEGALRQVGFPVKFSTTPCTLRRHVPSLGEHTEEVLLSLGSSEKEIEKLSADGVV